MGFPLPGIELRVADPETGVPLARARSAWSRCAGPNVFAGYWRQPEKTAEDFRPDGWFITGDLATIDADGYVRIVGRAKDLIISGGLNVYPKEVEDAARRPGGRGRVGGDRRAPPRLRRGGGGGGRRPAGRGAGGSRLAGGLRDRLARFKQPKRVFVVDDLPRNTMAKVQKNLLREQYGQIFDA